MSEIKPVYQYKTAGMLINYWQDIDEEAFIKLSKDHCYTTRILYPAAAYEALENFCFKTICFMLNFIGEEE